MIMDENAPLHITSEVSILLEERGIREDEIRQVLVFAESGRQFHTQVATGHRLAYFAPSKFTFWVEYEPEGGGYRIYRAYSHRMRILQGFNLPSKKEQAETGWICSACDLSLELAIIKLTYL